MSLILRQEALTPQLILISQLDSLDRTWRHLVELHYGAKQYEYEQTSEATERAR
jgi:hypothetical protein